MSQSRDEYYQENPEEYEEYVEPESTQDRFDRLSERPPEEQQDTEPRGEGSETESETESAEERFDRLSERPPEEQQDTEPRGAGSETESGTTNETTERNRQDRNPTPDQFDRMATRAESTRMEQTTDRTTDEQDTETNTPESIDSEQAQSLRSEVAGSAGAISVSDVSIRETGDGYEAFVPEPRQRQIVREQTASNFDVLGPSDVSVRETDDGLAGFLGDDAQRQVAANRLDVSPGDIVLENDGVRYSEEYAREQYAEELGSEFTGSDVSVERADDSWQLDSIDSGDITDFDGSAIADGVVDERSESVGQTTVTGFDPEAHPDSWSDALIDPGTSERVASTETILPSGAVTRLQDAGTFVGQELSERGEALGETVSAPLEGQAGETVENVVAGATGTAPAAIARAPGDAALGVERATQATTVALRDPGAAPGVARSAAGFGAAGVEGTAQAIVAEPAREGTAALALAGGTALATRGTARAAREWEMPDAPSSTRARDLLADERAQASLGERSRAREPTIGAEDIADPDRLGREVTPREYGEYELGPRQDVVLEGAPDFNPGATRRAERAQRQSVRDTGTALPAAGTGALVAGEMERVEAAGAQSVRALERSDTRTDTGLQTDVRSVTGTEQAFGFESERSQVATGTTAQAIEETTRPIPGVPGTPDTGRTPTTPPVPELPELSSGRSADRTDDVTGFGSLEVGDYIDIV